jgi:hypothetical protein
MWMKHAEHGGIADLPDILWWRAQGWEPTDGPPPELDLTKDPEAPVAEAPGLSAAQTQKSAATAKSKKES